MKRILASGKGQCKGPGVINGLPILDPLEASVLNSDKAEIGPSEARENSLDNDITFTSSKTSSRVTEWRPGLEGDFQTSVVQ